MHIFLQLLILTIVLLCLCSFIIQLHYVSNHRHFQLDNSVIRSEVEYLQQHLFHPMVNNNIETTAVKSIDSSSSSSSISSSGSGSGSISSSGSSSSSSISSSSGSGSGSISSSGSSSSSDTALKNSERHHGENSGASSSPTTTSATTGTTIKPDTAPSPVISVVPIVPPQTPQTPQTIAITNISYDSPLTVLPPLYTFPNLPPVVQEFRAAKIDWHNIVPPATHNSIWERFGTPVEGGSKLQR